MIWPVKNHDILGKLGSLVYTPDEWDAENIRKIIVKPRYLDDEYGWFYETYNLEIYFNSINKIKRFIAKNGVFQVSVPASLWGQERSYILLIRQSAKGTGVSEYELVVLHAGNEKIETVMSKKIAGFFDLYGNNWKYNVRITHTGIEPENTFLGLELHYDREFAPEKFIRKGLVKKDANYGQDMPKIICIVPHGQAVREFKGRRCQDVHDLD